MPVLSRFIVIDPEICHGQPTFRGTRILVKDVLDQVATGVAWEAFTDDWRGSAARDAIAEAVGIASELFEAHAAELVPVSG